MSVCRCAWEARVWMCAWRRQWVTVDGRGCRICSSQRAGVYVCRRPHRPTYLLTRAIQSATSGSAPAKKGGLWRTTIMGAFLQREILIVWCAWFLSFCLAFCCNYAVPVRYVGYIFSWRFRVRWAIFLQKTKLSAISFLQIGLIHEWLLTGHSKGWSWNTCTYVFWYA